MDRIVFKSFILLIAAVLASAEKDLYQNEKIPAGFVILFEGNGGTQNVVCNLEWAESETDKQWNFQDYDPCANDEARSIVIEYIKAGTILTVYDSPGGSKDDDYTVIKIVEDIDSPVIIQSFEQSGDFGSYKVEFHEKNGLDGKVSRFEMFSF